MNYKIYDADYFLRGRESGKSLYEDYRWLPDLTIPMVQRIVEHCQIEHGATVLDFGCARGYIVKALRGLEYQATGYDVSEWAVENADPEVAKYLTTDVKVAFDLDVTYEWIIAKDVLEHVEYIKLVIDRLCECATRGIFVVVPLTTFNGGKYVIKDYEKDITHIQRFNLPRWAELFIRKGWSVEVAYRMPGVKDNYYVDGWETGNGFITCRRIGS